MGKCRETKCLSFSRSTDSNEAKSNRVNYNTVPRRPAHNVPDSESDTPVGSLGWVGVVLPFRAQPNLDRNFQPFGSDIFWSPENSVGFEFEPSKTCYNGCQVN